MARVTRPGGRLVVCEFSHPTNAPFRTVYLEYLMKALPPISRAVSSSPDAYVYLAESIRAWPDQAGLAALLAEAGWADVEWRNLSGGIVALHRATRARDLNGSITQRLRALNPQVSGRFEVPDPGMRSGCARPRLCDAPRIVNTFTRSQTAVSSRATTGGAFDEGRNAGMELYTPVLALAILAAGFAVGSVVMSAVVGPKRYNRAKLDSYECGIEPTPHAVGGGRFPVKYYITAMMFIVFDIEIIFLYPWAVHFDAMGLFGLVEMVLFIATVFVAYAYVWRRGGLDWD